MDGASCAVRWRGPRTRTTVLTHLCRSAEESPCRSIIFASSCTAAFIVIVGCDSKTSNGGSDCSGNQDCLPGQVCLDSDCQTICGADGDCASGEICRDRTCFAGSRTDLPQIETIDGDGSPDGDTSNTAHHIGGKLIINGLHLDGSSVELTDGVVSWPLELCDATDTRLEVVLPETIDAAASYTLSVTTQAGTCAAPLPVLQGEQGLQGIAGSDGAQGVQGLQGPQGDAGGGLVLDLRLDEAGAVSSFSDSSAYGNDAVAPTGGTASGAGGHSGSAVAFSGGVLSIAANNSIPESPHVWVEVWIRPDSVAGASATILTKEGSYILRQLNGGISFDVVGAANPGAPCMFNTADGFLTAATWSHVAAWYDGVSAGIAIDGVTLASMVCTEGPVAPAFGSRFNIGGMWDGTTVTESFNGRIDELRVWHAAPQGVAERANKVHQIVTLTDSTRHNTIGGRTLNRNVPVLTINKQRAESKIMVQWSMTIGVDNDNVQIMWRTGSVTGTIVNVAGASHGHTNRSGACSTNAGFFIDDTRATGAISYYFTYGRGAGADNNTRLVVNCNANESGSYQQSSSTYVLSEIL